VELLLFVTVVMSRLTVSFSGNINTSINYIVQIYYSVNKMNIVVLETTAILTALNPVLRI